MKILQGILSESKEYYLEVKEKIKRKLSRIAKGSVKERLYDVYMGVDKTNPQIIQRVLDEDPDQGLLYAQQDPTAGDILLPKGDNYDQIHQLIQNTFTAPPQADIDVIQ